MDKQTAINLLGGTALKAAKVMGYKSRHAIYMWPETLPPSVADRVNGALMRMKTAKTRKQLTKVATSTDPAVTGV